MSSHLEPGGSRPAPRGAALAAALLPCLGACMTPAEHSAQADSEVYAIVEARRDALFEAVQGGPGGVRTAFTIQPPTDSLRHRLLAGESSGLGSLDLIESLQVAAENSRDYRARREALYAAALDLTIERWRFTVQESGSLGAQFSRPAINSENLDFDAGGALSRLLGTGALIVGDIGLNLFRNLARADGWDVVSDVGLSISQPLLRGFGRDVIEEPLTQAERNVVYEVRSYERFRRTFAVRVAEQMYRILQQENVVANEIANIANLEVLRERNEQLAAAGRLSDIQVDQARQDELRSRNRLISQQQSYQRLLDNFKLFLGLPIDADIECDLAERERLEEALSVPLDLDEDALVALALEERLDYRNVLGAIVDADRKIGVAANALEAGLDLQVDGRLRSVEGRPDEVSRDASSLTVGLDFDLPVNLIPERNAYRAAQITLQAAQRQGVEAADTIRADLREALRQARATREAYQIQRGAVVLAERRVESASLRQEAGRATTRDILESQEDLLDAQNAATAALIDHRLAQLALFRDLEVLRVDERGLTVESSLLEGLAAGEPAPAPEAPANLPGTGPSEDT